jgi:hypothetical protein
MESAERGSWGSKGERREGVEDEATYELLKDCGIDWMQGYLSRSPLARLGEAAQRQPRQRAVDGDEHREVDHRHDHVGSR